MSEKQLSGEISEIIKRIEGLNLGQVSELIDEIKSKYNIQETAVIQTASEGQTSEKVKEEISNVSVKLVDIGAQKVQVYNVIKTAIKDLKGAEINIIEAKKLTEAEGAIIFSDIAKDKAETVKKQLEEKGAKVEIK